MQFWKLLFWPLNYIPMKTENRPLGVTLRAAPGLGLLIVAFTQLPPRGWAAHYYLGQLELTRKRVCTHTARLARSLLSRVSRNSPFPLGATTVAGQRPAR